MKHGMSKLRGTWVILTILVVCLLGVSSHAQMIADPARNAPMGHFEFGGIYNASEIDYESDEYYDDATVERQVVGVYGAYGLTEEVDMFLAGGYIIKVENPEDVGDDGSGFIGQLGVRGRILQKDAFSLRAYGLVNYISEDYGEYYYRSYTYTYSYSWGTVSMGDYEEGTGETTATFVEATLGLLAAYDIEDVRFYGGIEAVPYQSSEIEAATGDAEDIERADIAVGRLGVQYAPGNWWIRGELSLVGESGFTIGAGVSL